MKEVRREMIEIEGGFIPISLIEDDNPSKTQYVIQVDDVEWLKTDNSTHAVVLFEMMWDNLPDYVEYRMKV